MTDPRAPAVALVLLALATAPAHAQAGPPATGYIAPPVTGYLAPPPLPGYGVGAPAYGPGGVIVRRRPLYPNRALPFDRRRAGVVRAYRSNR